MAWEALKAAVSAVITDNGSEEITGAVLRTLINSNIIPQLGKTAEYKGVATPSTSPGTPENNVLYLSVTPGTYSNFSGYVHKGGLVAHYWNGTFWDNQAITSTKVVSQLYAFINPDWVYQGEAAPGQTAPAASNNHLYVPTTNGTIFGVSITDSTKQVLVGNGSSFVRTVVPSAAASGTGGADPVTRAKASIIQSEGNLMVYEFDRSRDNFLINGNGDYQSVNGCRCSVKIAVEQGVAYTVRNHRGYRLETAEGVKINSSGWVNGQPFPEGVSYIIISSGFTPEDFYSVEFFKTADIARVTEPRLHPNTKLDNIAQEVVGQFGDNIQDLNDLPLFEPSANLVDPLRLLINYAPQSTYSQILPINGWSTTNYLPVTQGVVYTVFGNYHLYSEVDGTPTKSVSAWTNRTQIPIGSDINYIVIYDNSTDLGTLAGRLGLFVGVQSVMKPYKRGLNPLYFDTYKHLSNSDVVGALTYNSAVKYNVLRDGVNVINPYDATLGVFIHGNGNPQTVAGWYHTARYPVQAGEVWSWLTFGAPRFYLTNGSVVETGWTSGTACPANITHIQLSGGNGQINTYSDIKDFLGRGVHTERIPYGKQFDHLLIEERDANLRKSYKPFEGKRVFMLGDSFTMNGFYFSELLRTTGMVRSGSTAGDGNGMTLTGFAGLLANYTSILQNTDVVTVLGGTNDYNHGGTTIGAYTDAAGANTLYGAFKAIVNAVYAVNPAIQIVFFSQPERGSYNGSPANTTPPGTNQNGLNMHNIAMAMEDFCNRRGLPYGNTHQKLWTMEQLNIYTSDNLHPNILGGDKLGRIMGKVINDL